MQRDFIMILSYHSMFKVHNTENSHQRPINYVILIVKYRRFDDLRFLSLFSIFYNDREMLLQILTNYLNASWETRYILDMWHRCVKRSRFVFFFFSRFPFCTVGSSRWGSRERKEPSINHISLLYTHGRVWLPTSHNQCVALEWLLVRNESNAFRMPREYRRLDQPLPPLHSFHSLSLNTIRVKRCRCSIP